jgi:hypothetical protein
LSELHVPVYTLISVSKFVEALHVVAVYVVLFPTTEYHTLEPCEPQLDVLVGTSSVEPTFEVTGLVYGRVMGIAFMQLLLGGTVGHVTL